MNEKYLKKKLFTILAAVVVLVASVGIEKMSEGPKGLILQIGTGLFSLTSEHWLGLGATFSATFIAWIIAVAGGYVVGVLVSSVIVFPEKTNKFVSYAQALDVVFLGIYIVPLVLTLSLVYALGMKAVADGNLSGRVFALMFIATAGLALGGYHVYRSVFNAVKQAKQESRYIIDSLYLPSGGDKPWWRLWISRFRAVRRFRDCEIHNFCESITIAFHLALVSVMILETITPNFYELFFPQSGVVRSWLGGAGRQILVAQNTYGFQIIAGFLWAVLLFDFLVVSVIELVLHKVWRRHYREEL